MQSTLRRSAAAARIAAHSLRPANRPGPDVISLASGDPDFETPPYIRAALIEAINAGYTHYVDNQGDPELRAAIAASLRGRGAGHLAAADVLVTHGASGAISAAFLALIDPGDRVIIPEPTYSVYADVLRLIGAEPVLVPTDPAFHLDFDRLEAVSAGARMMVICNPNNPVGVVYRRDELERLAALAERCDLFVFSDEAYEHLVFDNVEFTSSLAIPELQHRLIYCASLSKTYAMTGWRVGYLAGPTWIVREATRMHRSVNNALNASVQRAALAALTTPSDWPERMRLEYQARREIILDMLRTDPAFEFTVPEGAFYTFIRNPIGLTSAQMVEMALEYGVAIRSGAEYGPSGEGFFRITFATGRDQLIEGLRRLRMINQSQQSR